jgi:hypothetical protein
MHKVRSRFDEPGSARILAVRKGGKADLTMIQQSQKNSLPSSATYYDLIWISQGAAQLCTKVGKSRIRACKYRTLSGSDGMSDTSYNEDPFEWGSLPSRL